jgi:hypothetical protein
MGWTTEESGFDSQQGPETFLRWILGSHGGVLGCNAVCWTFRRNIAFIVIEE